MSSIADVWVTVRGDVSHLSGDIVEGAAKPIEKAGKESAGRFGRAFSGNKTVLNALGAAAGQIIGTAVGRGAGAILTGSAADSLGRFSTNISSLGGGLAVLGVSAGALGTVAAAADGLSGASDLLASSTGALSGAKAFFTATTNAETGAVTASGIARARDTVLTLAHTAAEKGAAAASKVFAVGQWLVNAALTANPIGLVIVGVAALVAGFVLAYKKSETFRGVIHRLWAILQKFIGFTPLGAILTHFDAIKDRIGWILGKISDLGHKLTHLPGAGVLGKIPGFARGGVLKPGLSIVGERGPEMIASARGGQKVFSNTELLRFAKPQKKISKIDFVDTARLDTSQIQDHRKYKRVGVGKPRYYEDGSVGYDKYEMRPPPRPRQPQHKTLTINGGVHIVAHKVESATDAASRGLRGVAHKLGF